MTTAYAEALFIPGPDTPAIDPALVVASYVGAVAHYGDRVWPLAPLVDNPSAARESILWNKFPQVMREEFRYIAWHMVNRALPDTFRIGKAPSWRTRQGASALYRTVLNWRAFARWLGKRGISTLVDCTEEVFHDYGLSLARAPKANRSTVGHQLVALTRLWAFDDGTALPRGIAEPPWVSKGRDDYLPAATAVTGENSTEPLAPATMGPLLIWAMRVIDDFADDILAAWAENRRITAQAGQAVATRETLAAIKRYLRGLAEHGRPVPAYRLPGGPQFARTYISSLTGAPTKQIDNVLRGKKLRVLRQYLVSNPGSCPMSVPVAGRVEGEPWTQVLDFTEAASLMRHLGTAAFIVMSYLTGMRPQEVLGLRTGCCPDPDAGQHLINGHIYKTATDEHGNHRSEGELRDVPWVAITPVVNAIRVLERIVDDGALLFDGTSHDFINRRKFTGSVTFSAWRERIEDFAAWASGLATKLGRPHETVPADPNGAIGTERFRRTLAWHIARRPGGLVALAIQYGHLRTAISGGYASRSRDGVHDLLDIETARATADTLATLHDDLAEGVGISGPAARRAIHAASHAPTYAGTIVSARAARDLLENPSLSVHDNPKAYLMCVYNREKALCHRLAGQQKAPSLDRCQPTCANITRTDHHAAQLMALADVLEKQAGALTPAPMGKRLQARADSLRTLAENHHDGRLTLAEASA